MKNMTQIAVMLGGNLPGTENAMAEALRKFSVAGVQNITVSKIVKSAAEDCVPGTPDFLDMAFTGSWQGSAEELLRLCQKIEIAAGRPEIHSSRESRILDCDIIFFGETHCNSPHLTIPHPRAHLRRFVLEPLAEIIPDMRFADGKTVKDVLAGLPSVE